MTELARWSYTAPLTIWRALANGKDKFGDPVSGYEQPEVIYGDYQGGLARGITGIGEIVAKDTYWTEYPDAQVGDYIARGVFTTIDPLSAGADEIRAIVRYADTFERDRDDYALITGV